MQVEGDRYYVELDGVKYYWEAQYEAFLKDGYAVNNDGVPAGGIPRSAADPGCCDLDEAPNAKPKVKKTGEGRYDVEYQGDAYCRYESEQACFNGGPCSYAGKPLGKSDVDLDGHTLP